MIETLKKMAIQYDWTFLCHQGNINMLSFTKGSARMNIYYTKMTVATCINHPKKGKTQLFRKKISFKELRKLFKNPRQHTRKGYYTT